MTQFWNICAKVLARFEGVCERDFKEVSWTYEIGSSMKLLFNIRLILEGNQIE